MRRVEELAQSIQERIPPGVDMEQGCQWCGKIRRKESLFCSDECARRYTFHNARFERPRLLACDTCDYEYIIQDVKKIPEVMECNLCEGGHLTIVEGDE